MLRKNKFATATIIGALAAAFTLVAPMNTAHATPADNVLINNHDTGLGDTAPAAPCTIGTLTTGLNAQIAAVMSGSIAYTTLDIDLNGNKCTVDAPLDLTAGSHVAVSTTIHDGTLNAAASSGSSLINAAVPLTVTGVTMVLTTPNTEAINLLANGSAVLIDNNTFNLGNRQAIVAQTAGQVKAFTNNTFVNGTRLPTKVTEGYPILKAGSGTFDGATLTGNMDSAGADLIYNVTNKTYAGCFVYQWTVTFDGNGGLFGTDTTSDELVLDSKYATAPTTPPTLDGKHVSGWSDTVGGVAVDLTKTAIYGDKTFYAIWADGAPEPEPGPGPSTGYTATFDCTQVPTGLTLPAGWCPSPLVQPNVATVTSLPTGPTGTGWDGYVLTWVQFPTGTTTTPVSFALPFTLTVDTTFVATWSTVPSTSKNIPIKVKFDANTPCDKCDSTATGPDPSSQQFVMAADKHGNFNYVVDSSHKKIQLTTGMDFVPATNVSITGYVFQGWAIKTSIHGYLGSVLQLIPGTAKGSVNVPDSAASCDKNGNNCSVTLYAVWAPAQVKVIFDANAPSGVQVKGMPSAIKAPFCSSIKVKGDPKADGFTFMGWNTAADGSGTAYAPGDKILINVFSTDKKGNNSLTLYAQWAPGNVTPPPGTPDETPTPSTPVVPPVSPAPPIVPAPTGGSIAGSGAAAGLVGMLMLVAAGGVFMVSRRRLAIH